MVSERKVGPAVTRVTVPYPPYAYRMPAAAARQWQRVHVIVHGKAANGKLSLEAARVLTSAGMHAARYHRTGRLYGTVHTVTTSGHTDTRSSGRSCLAGSRPVSPPPCR